MLSRSKIAERERVPDDTACMSRAQNRKAQVVIVGAGLAGLATAQRLYQSGVKDIILLEAQNRVGGRVHTINHSDYVLELGAQWLHGADDNPLHKWLVEKNMLDDFEDGSTGFKGIFCNSSGNEIDQRIVTRVLDILMDCRISLSNSQIEAKVAKNAAELFKSQLEVKMSEDEELLDNKELVFAIFDWFLRYETIENSCDSMQDVSILSYTDWTDSGDGSLLNFKRGYKSLLQWFCKQIPSKKLIQLNKQVINIERLDMSSKGFWYDQDGLTYNAPVLVKYLDSKTSERDSQKIDNFNNIRIIECDHVVVTVSLGVLKQNHATLFKPPLPNLKRKLIESMGFGTVNKIILQFEEPFWNDNHGIKLIWNENDQSNFPVWVQDILAFDIVRRQPNLLIGWIGGRGATLMEKESDLKIGETCLMVLNQFLPTACKKPSRLVNCICSRWNSNPYVNGSYSYHSMDSFAQSVDKLHEPIYNSAGKSNDKSLQATNSAVRKPRILFAGEATAGKLYSTTHGAIISGWREADRLRDYLSSEKQSNIQQSETNQQSIAPMKV